MSWKSTVNRAITATTGLMLVRAENVHAPQAPPVPPPAPPPTPPVEPPNTLRIPRTTLSPVRGPAHPETDRLLDRPVFLLSTVRSGSTLLRLILNAHSQLHAPHELHVRRLRVVPTNTLSITAMEMLGHDEADLEHLLWDRVLHRELQLSGKPFIVDKTPSNSFVFKRIQTAWPDARFIFLLRHPASIAASWADASAGRRTKREAVDDALRYMRALDKARLGLTGLTVRYEELTEDPEKVTREICTYLDIEWEPEMLAYGEGAPLAKGVGDWTDKIRSGSVQPGRELPRDEDIPRRLRSISRRWGYLSDPDAEL